MNSHYRLPLKKVKVSPKIAFINTFKRAEAKVRIHVTRKRNGRERRHKTFARGTRKNGKESDPF